MIPVWEIGIILVIAVLLHLFLNSVVDALASKVKGHPIKKAALEALKKPLPLYLWLVAIVITTNAFSQRFLDYPLIPDSKMWLKATFWLFFAWFLFRWKSGAIKNHPFQEKTSRDLLDKTLTVLILFITLVSILDVTGQSMATLVAFGGVSGLAIAFASQQVIANFFGGLMIYLTKPFTIGDWVKLPEKDVEGHVEEIGWYMTLIRTLDKRPLYVPNSAFSSLLVMTPSRMSHREILEMIGVRYEDFDKVPAILKDIREFLLSYPKIDKKEKIVTHLDKYEASSIDLRIQCYTKDTESVPFHDVKQAILIEIAKILTKHKAEMAFPTQVIHYKPND
jgi:MscS family membrane protein